jgi:hypothetical protein
MRRYVTMRMSGDRDDGFRQLRVEAWMMPAFKALARLRGLRGTALDIFGHSAGCKFERELILAPILWWGFCGSGCRP